MLRKLEVNSDGVSFILSASSLGHDQSNLEDGMPKVRKLAFGDWNLGIEAYSEVRQRKSPPTLKPGI